jgi:hypothetical protein
MRSIRYLVRVKPHPRVHPDPRPSARFVASRNVQWASPKCGDARGGQPKEGRGAQDPAYNGRKSENRSRDLVSTGWDGLGGTPGDLETAVLIALKTPRRPSKGDREVRLANGPADPRPPDFRAPSTPSGRLGGRFVRVSSRRRLRKIVEFVYGHRASKLARDLRTMARLHAELGPLSDSGSRSPRDGLRNRRRRVACAALKRARKRESL